MGVAGVDFQIASAWRPARFALGRAPGFLFLALVTSPTGEGGK
jgi:hypothetical protein